MMFFLAVLVLDTFLRSSETLELTAYWFMILKWASI